MARRTIDSAGIGKGAGVGKRRRGITHRYRAPVSVLTVFVAAAVGACFGHIVVRPRTSQAFPKRAERAMQNHRNFEGGRGPWGQFQYSRIAIAMPDEYAAYEPVREPIRWWFDGFSRERVESLFRDAGLTPEQLVSLGQGGWDISSKGVVVNPPRQLVADLSPVSRGRIYEVLSGNPLNDAQHSPEVLYPEYLEEHLESSGLGAETLGMFRKLLYPRGSGVLFSDPQVIVPTLQNGQDRQRFQQLVHRRMTFLVQLVIDETSDIDAMVAYWDFPGRPKGLRTLFESLARVPGGGELDIAHLLPPFARRRLYTFPDPSTDPSSLTHDCVWTSLNFFNDQPDDRLEDPEYKSKVIEQEYRRVDSPRFGDLALLLNPSTELSVHAAVYLADNLVFTKNGFSAMQPWVLMTLSDVVTFYSITSPDRLKLQYYRRKG
jgi:hypothetical protein